MPTILLNNIRPGGKLLKNLKVGSTEVKYVKRGDGKFFYDTQKDTTYSDITISSFSYSTNTVAASGGSTSTPSYAYSQSATPVGYAGNYSASSKTSGATVSFSKVSGDGASVDTSTGVVTFDSRGTSYSASTREAVVRITVSLNGKSKTKDCTVYQAKNVITSMTYSASSGGALNNPATYAASANSKDVTNKTAASATVQLTFSSGSKSTSYSTYGTLTTTYSWSSNQNYATLTSANSSSISVTMTSRGNTYSASIRTATITRTASFSFSLSSTYNNANLSAVTTSKTATATVTQEANTFTKVSIGVNAGAITAPGNYGAGSSAQNVSNKTSASLGTVTLTFKSGSTTTSYSTYGSISGPVYSWSSNQTYATLTSANSASLSVTMASRGTTYASGTRTAVITRTAKYTYTLSSSYTGFSATSNQASCTATITQAANTITISSITVNKGALTNPATYSAGENTKSVANKTAATASGVLKFASGSEVDANSTYGSWSGPTYSWSSNQTYATLTSSNAASLNVTMASRGKTYSASTRSATITRTASFTYTLSSTYGGASKSNSAGATATVTQAANTITISVTVNGGALTNPATYGAGANTKSVANKTAATASGTLTWSSGSTNAANSTYGSWSGPTYSWSSNQSYATLTSSNAASLNVTMTSRGTTYSTGTRAATITRTATFKYTLNSANGGGSKSNTGNATATVTQAKNVITSVTVSINAGSISHSAGTVAAKGGTVSITNSSSASYSGTMNYSSGGTLATSSSYGSWSASYSWTESDSGGIISFTSANTSTMSVTVASRGTSQSASTISATVYRKYTATFTLNSSYNNGCTSGTNNNSASVTITQAKNTASIVYNTPTISSATSSDIPASGGTFTTSYLTVKYSQTAYYSYDSGSNTSANPYYVANGYTATTTMLTFTGTAPSGSDLATTATARTKKGSVTVYVTANSKKSAGKAVDVYQAQNKVESTYISNFHIPYFGYGGMFNYMGSFSSGAFTVYPYVPTNFYASSSDRYTSGKYKSSSLTISKSSCTLRYSLAAGSYFNINTSTGVISARADNYNGYNYLDTVLLTISYNGNNYSTQTRIGQLGYQSYGSYATTQYLRVSCMHEAVITFHSGSTPPNYQQDQEKYAAYYIPPNSDFGFGVYIPVDDSSAPSCIYGVDGNGQNTVYYRYSQVLYVFQKVKNSSNYWTWQRIGSFTFSEYNPVQDVMVSTVSQVY